MGDEHKVGLGVGISSYRGALKVISSLSKKRRHKRVDGAAFLGMYRGARCCRHLLSFYG